MLQMISVEGAEVWPGEATPCPSPPCTVEGRGCCWRNVKADQSRTTATRSRGGACDTQLASVALLGRCAMCSGKYWLVTTLKLGGRMLS